MNKQLAWLTLWAGLIIGTVADILLNGQRLGINVPILLLVGLISLEYIAWKEQIRLRNEAHVLLWLSLPFAVCLAWRDSTVLTVVNIGCIGVIGTLVALRGRSGSFSNASIAEYLLRTIPVAYETTVGFVSLLRREVPWNETAQEASRNLFLVTMRGICIAIPVLLVFGALFSSADAEFAKAATQIFNWNYAAIWSNSWITMLMAVLTIGAIKVLLIWRDSWTAPDRPIWAALGSGEILIVMLLLNILFAAFVAIQFMFLFGEHSAHGTVAGLTYAQYARGGFFELVWVSVLVLPIMLGLQWLFTKDSGIGLFIFRLLNFLLVCQLSVVMLSAVYRMQLYVLAFGLTELRLYTTVFMLWLAIVFAWLLITFLSEHRERFAFGAAAAGLTVIFALNVFDPEQTIVHYNRTKVINASSLDTDYFKTLSADSVPEIEKYIAQTKDTQKKTDLESFLRSQYKPNSQFDWRSWNWSRQIAQDDAER